MLKKGFLQLFTVVATVFVLGGCAHLSSINEGDPIPHDAEQYEAQ